MKFTEDLKSIGDKLFASLKELDGYISTENSATTEASTEKVEPVKDEAPVIEAKAEDIVEPKAEEKVEAPDAMKVMQDAIVDLTKELANVKQNLNSTLEANASLTEKMVAIMAVPNTIKEVKNARPVEMDLNTQWDEVLKARLNATK